MSIFSDEPQEIQHLFFLKQYCIEFNLDYKKELDRLTKIYSDHPLVLFFQLQYEFERRFASKERDEAVQIYLNKINELSGEDPALLYVKGMLRLKRYTGVGVITEQEEKEGKEGKNSLLKAAKNDWSPAWFKLAEIDFRSGEKDSGIEKLEKGTCYITQLKRAHVLFLAGKEEEAKDLIFPLKNSEQILFARQAGMGNLVKFYAESVFDKYLEDEQPDFSSDLKKTFFLCRDVANNYVDRFIEKYNATKKACFFETIKYLAFLGSDKAQNFILKYEEGKYQNLLSLLSFDSNDAQHISNPHFLTPMVRSVSENNTNLFLKKCQEGKISFDNFNFSGKKPEEIKEYFVQKLKFTENGLDKMAQQVVKRNWTDPITIMFQEYFNAMPLPPGIRNLKSVGQDGSLDLRMDGGTLFLSVTSKNHYVTYIIEETNVEEEIESDSKATSKTLPLCCYVSTEYKLGLNEEPSIQKVDLSIYNPLHFKIVSAIFNNKKLDDQTLKEFFLSEGHIDTTLFEAIKNPYFLEMIAALESEMEGKLFVMGGVENAALSRKLLELHQLFPDEEKTPPEELAPISSLNETNVHFAPCETENPNSVSMLDLLKQFLTQENAFCSIFESSSSSSSGMAESQPKNGEQIKFQKFMAMCAAIKFIFDKDIYAEMKKAVFSNLETIKDQYPVVCHSFFGPNADVILDKIKEAKKPSDNIAILIKQQEYVLELSKNEIDGDEVELYKIYWSISRKSLFEKEQLKYTIRKDEQTIIRGKCSAKELGLKVFEAFRLEFNKPDQDLNQILNKKDKKNLMDFLISKKQVKKPDYTDVKFYLDKIPFLELEPWLQEIFPDAEYDGFVFSIWNYINSKMVKDSSSSLRIWYGSLISLSKPEAQDFDCFSEKIYAAINSLSKFDKEKLANSGDKFYSLILSVCNQFKPKGPGYIKDYISNVCRQLESFKDIHKNVDQQLNKLSALKNVTYITQKVLDIFLKEIKYLNSLKDSREIIGARQFSLGVFFRVAYAWGGALANNLMQISESSMENTGNYGPIIAALAGYYPEQIFIPTAKGENAYKWRVWHNLLINKSQSEMLNLSESEKNILDFFPITQSDLDALRVAIKFLKKIDVSSELISLIQDFIEVEVETTDAQHLTSSSSSSSSESISTPPFMCEPSRRESQGRSISQSSSSPSSGFIFTPKKTAAILTPKEILFRRELQKINAQHYADEAHKNLKRTNSKFNESLGLGVVNASSTSSSSSSSTDSSFSSSSSSSSGSSPTSPSKLLSSLSILSVESAQQKTEEGGVVLLESPGSPTPKSPGNH